MTLPQATAGCGIAKNAEVKISKDNRGERVAIMNQAGGDEAFLGDAGRDNLCPRAFDASPNAQLIVDTNGLVALFNDRARTLFGLAPTDLGRAIQDLEVSYRPVDLRALVAQAIEQRGQVLLRDMMSDAVHREPRYYDIHVAPLTDDGGRTIGVSITFADVSRVQELQLQLNRSKQDLETAYEELQSTNLQLETTNDELQSTVEELETTNETLQSTNEELATMNEELQSTNEELQTRTLNGGVLASLRRHGKVRQEGSEQGQACDARTEARYAQVRPLGEARHEPQTGDCDRAQRGAARRRQSSTQTRPIAQERGIAKTERRPQEVARRLTSTVGVHTIASRCTGPSRSFARFVVLCACPFTLSRSSWVFCSRVSPPSVPMRSHSALCAATG